MNLAGETAATLTPDNIRMALNAITTVAAVWVARTVFDIRDNVRTISHELFGKDGDNGIKSLVMAHAAELETIKARNIAMDAVAEAEADQYEGEDRRQGNRRLRDIIREEIDKSVTPTPHRKAGHA